MKVIRMTQPTVEPVSIDDALAHLRLDTFDDVGYVQGLIAAAREHVENYCNRPFAEATFAIIYDGELPSDEMTVAVPLAGVTAVSAVKYRDEDGNVQTWAAENYRHDADRQTLTPLVAWPAGTDLRIEVAAGGTVPEAIKAAIKLVLGDLYELRVATVTGTSVIANPAAQALMHMYRERMGI